MSTGEVFVARQPIFDRRKNVYAYELLFRAADTETSTVMDGDAATAHVITNSLLSIGFDLVAGGKKVFVNFTRDLLLNDTARLLPEEKSVVELLESIKADDEVLKACRNLKLRGYPIALDDFVSCRGMEKLLALADVVKIDFMATDSVRRKELVQTLRRIAPQAKLLAEKVETIDQQEEARNQGFDYFQGYFFEKPALFKGQQIPGFRITYLRIMQAIHDPCLDFEGMENIIKADMSLSAKLLQYINVAAFPWARRIESIRQALVLLGESQVRKWVSLVALSELVGDKPQELALNAAIRGRFCELLGQSPQYSATSLECFMLGALSLLDAMVDLPLEEALALVKISDRVARALVVGDNELKPLLDVAVCMERGQWDVCLDMCADLGIAPDVLSGLQLEALEWAQRVFES
jgi:EAL and modified HD-GYP domain-containing signal transduction protein